VTEHTKDKLAKVLCEAGLTGMAAQAATGYYHDYLSPLDLPEIALVNDLALAASQHPEKHDAIIALRQRVIDGDFNATKEESDDWAESPEGQETMKWLKNKTRF
jgi:hypothetical protein